MSVCLSVTRYFCFLKKRVIRYSSGVCACVCMRACVCALVCVYMQRGRIYCLSTKLVITKMQGKFTIQVDSYPVFKCNRYEQKLWYSLLDVKDLVSYYLIEKYLRFCLDCAWDKPIFWCCKASFQTQWSHFITFLLCFETPSLGEVVGPWTMRMAISSNLSTTWKLHYSMIFFNGDIRWEHQSTRPDTRQH